ncbi:MAG: anthranilate phosphoribosyltransferase [Acidobacteria bacterium]|nr:anthranilate phosphoribosyltransferase [Acidobacteriota bacterium]
MTAVEGALKKAAARQDLTEAEASEALDEILEGEAEPALIGGLLTALSMKGETVDEVVGFARSMRSHAAPVAPVSVRPEQLVDTCGTGGGAVKSFNISTASAFVVAGAGVPVAKHGNRSITSRCGSADVLEELGANVQLTPAQAAEAIDEVGFGFLFAPLIHPAMRSVQPVRKALKIRTVFNILGPLTNPAGAGAQVLGVADERLLPLVSQALVRLGVRRAFVVHGDDGLDEVTTTTSTQLAEVRDGAAFSRQITPDDFDLPRALPGQLLGGDRVQNASIVRAVLEGSNGPARDIVCANASLALVASGAAADLLEGMALARQSIDRGAAMAKLESFVALTQSYRAD